MSIISIQVNQGPATIPAGQVRKTTKVDVLDAASAAQSFSLDGTESPLGFIPQVTVASGAGSVTVSDIDANGAVIGTPAVTQYTTIASTAQLASTGASVVVVTP
jgi:hypothetical protein